jgi:hypothetical protein
VGFPVYEPDDPERPELVNSVKEQARKHRIEEYWRSIISEEKCGPRIEGETLFSGEISAQTPKW